MLNLCQKAVFEYVKNNSKIKLLCLGSAGTGKSFLINSLIKFLRKEEENNIIISSYQAISTNIISGITLHKLFGFKDEFRSNVKINIDNDTIHLTKSNGKYIFKKKFRNSNTGFLNDVFFSYKTNWLILDEVSNISIEMLDDIVEILSVCNLFEELNFLIFGDLYQLKPIRETPIYEISLEDHYLKDFKFFELTTNVRQKDEEFFELCEKIKTGLLKSKHKKMLHERTLEELKKNNITIDPDIIYIYPRKSLCEEHNLNRLLSLEERKYTFTALDDIYDQSYYEKYKENCFGLTEKLTLSKGSKVMICSNFILNNESFSNGEIGMVKSINLKSKVYNNILDYTLDVFLEDRGKTIVLEPITKQNDLDSSFKTFTRTMFPLQLSWAVTTHKIQGMTLEKAVIDMGYNNFDPVQLYVNITRIKSLDGVFIKHLELPLKKNVEHTKIKNFIDSLKK